MTKTVNIVMDKATIGPSCSPTSVVNRPLPELTPLGVAIEWATDKDTFRAPLYLRGDRRSIRNVVMDGRDVFGIQSSPASLEDTLFELYRIGVFQRPIRELLEELSEHLEIREDFPAEDMPDLEKELVEAGYTVGEVISDPDNPLVAHIGLTWGSSNQSLKLNGPQFTFEDAVEAVPHELQGIAGLLTEEFKQSPEWVRALQQIGRALRTSPQRDQLRQHITVGPTPRTPQEIEQAHQEADELIRKAENETPRRPPSLDWLE